MLDLQHRACSPCRHWDGYAPPTGSVANIISLASQDALQTKLFPPRHVQDLGASDGGQHNSAGLLMSHKNPGSAGFDHTEDIALQIIMISRELAL